MTVDAKVEFLKRADSYSDRPRKVETVETHISWVFLTENYAYKLKKPVRYEFLDFRTIDARHHDCDEEIRLNRRLARDVYIAAVPLNTDEAGKLHLGENRISENSKLEGESSEGGGDASPYVRNTVDWLVKMRRLPAEKMLDYAIKNRTLREIDVTRVALMLAKFYEGSSPVEIAPSKYRQRFEADIQANLRELTTPVYGMPIDLASGICAAQLEFLKRESQLFAWRVQEGRIIEAHGDLRPEHICLETEPVIIDSLEFKREFRILDPADELSFLALECELLGAPPFVTNLIFETYSRITSDIPPQKLVQFYKSHRAGLRAKLAVWHLREPKIPDISKWLILARKYLDLADAHIREACVGFY
jgi:aminoglycoside phosphotransferase family enzyme